MVNLLNYIISISKKISKYTLSITIVMGIVMTLTVLLNIIGRYLLGFSLPWGAELPRYLLIALTFLGSSVALERDRHVRLTVVLKLFPKKISIIILTIGNLLIGWFLYYFIKYSIILVIEEGFTQSMPVMQFPMFYIYVFMPIAGILMFIHLIKLISQNILIFLEGEPEEKIIKEERVL